MSVVASKVYQNEEQSISPSEELSISSNGWQSDDDYSPELLRRKLVAIFQNRCKNTIDAEDIVQEVLVRMYTRLAKGDVIENPFYFALGIARNVEREEVRKARKAQRELSLDSALNKEIDGRDIMESLSVTPAVNLEYEELSQLFQRCVHELPTQDYEILNQYYFLGTTSKELAAKLGITENNLRVKIHRIRNALWKSWRRMSR